MRVANVPDNKSPVVLTLSSAFYKVAAVSGNQTYYTETVENIGSLSKLVGGFTKIARDGDRRYDDRRYDDRRDDRWYDDRRDGRRDGRRYDRPRRRREPRSQLEQDEYGITRADRNLARDLAIRFKLLGKEHKSLDESSLIRMLATGSEQERGAVLEMARATEHIDPRKGPGALSDQDRAALEQASGDLSGMHQERQRVYDVQRAGREKSFGGLQDQYTRLKGEISEVEKNLGRNKSAIEGFEAQLKAGKPLTSEQERAYRSAIRVKQELEKKKTKLDTRLTYAASGGKERGLVGRAARAVGQAALKGVTLGKYQTDTDVSKARKNQLVSENEESIRANEKTVADLEAKAKTPGGLSEDEQNQLAGAKDSLAKGRAQQASLQKGLEEPKSLASRFGSAVGGVFKRKTSPDAGAAAPGAAPGGAPGAAPPSGGAAGAAPPPPPSGGAAGAPPPPPPSGGTAGGAATPPPAGGAAGAPMPPPPPMPPPGGTPSSGETPEQRAARLAREKAQAAQTAQQVGSRNPVPPMIPKPPTGPAAGSSSA